MKHQIKCYKHMCKKKKKKKKLGVEWKTPKKKS